MKKTKPTPVRRGGRPSQRQAEQMRGKILDAARDLFLIHGYGATSIESIAARAHISKRTFYARFTDKADIFKAVVHQVIEGLRPPDMAPNMASLFTGEKCEDILLHVATLLLRAVLMPQALALHRLLLSESARFPELAQMASAEGSRAEAVKRIAALLQHEIDAKRFKMAKPAFAAEQFLHMVSSYPQRRAMGIGKPMTKTELDTWARDSLALFLNGCKGKFD